MRCGLDCFLFYYENIPRKNIRAAIAQTGKKAVMNILARLIVQKNYTEAERYLDNLLTQHMPTTDKLTNQITLRCDYKAVTYEMLKDTEFQAQIKKQFPLVEWTAPLEEYTAAKSET